MGVEGFVGPGNQSGIIRPGGQPRLTIEVRRVGPNTYEARCESGRFSVVGYSPRGAIFDLLGTGKLPSHHESDVVIVPDPEPTSDPDYEL